MFQALTQARIHRLFVRLGVPFVTVVALAASCTTSDSTPEIEVSPEPTAKAEPAHPKDKLEALESVMGRSGRLFDELADVRLMLQAEAFEAHGKLQDATKSWYAALGTARGRFGKRALEAWIKSYTNALGKKTDAKVLTRLLLAETQNGAYSPYMRLRNLTSEAALLPLVEANAAPWLLPQTDGSGSAALEPPAEKGLPASDPLLVKTAAQNCAASSAALDSKPSWQAWYKSLSPETQQYWQALLQQCSNQSSEALKKFLELYPLLAKSKATHALAIEAASRAGAMQRALVQRNQAADTYLAQMALWNLPGVTPEAFGLDPLAFMKRRIDETMWASRYRALIGDYEAGKVYAHKALDLIANAYAEAPQASTQAKEDLASLRAEAYHILAYRIALENREFQSALSLNLLALQTPYLNKEWQERLAWFAGVYEYLGGNFEGAKTKWETLLSHTKEDSMRAMLYYWLARAHHSLDHAAEEKFYLKTVVDEYPLSYYATVAPLMSGLKPEKDWREAFNEPHHLAERLEQTSNLQLKALRQSATLAPLLRRAEALVAANLDQWSRLAVSELELAMNSDLQPEAQPEAFVYLTRLQYSSGNYLGAIGLTSKLAKAIDGFWRRFPEQIIVYFPRPYADTYTRNAGDSGVDKELLLAISRQESGFTPDIRSSANALGVMQLIRPTAERFSEGIPLANASLDAALRNPELNIKMGSRYLKQLTLHYKSFWPAVYGGYNAGEYAVDTWLKKRGHSDPLMFVELVPFNETKDYIKNVWRNVHVYKFLESVRINYRRPRLADPALEAAHQRSSPGA